MNSWVGFKKDVCMRSDSMPPPPPPSGFRLTQDSLGEASWSITGPGKACTIHMLHKHACAINDSIIFKRGSYMQRYNIISGLRKPTSSESQYMLMRDAEERKKDASKMK